MGIRRIRLAILILHLTAVLAAAAGEVPKSPWKFSAAAGLRETYDSNVYLQNSTDKAHEESMVTTASIALGLTFARRGDWDTTLSLGYAPQYNWYHAEPDESHFTHVGTGNFLARKGQWTLELNNTLTHIDGEDEGLVFTGPGGAPAVGGIPIRDRRDATIFRAGYRLSWAQGSWLIRPVFSAYVHDFHTDHRSTPGYLNYVDRNDFNGGVDVGYKVTRDLYVLAGYRYGHQKQPALLSSPIEYSNVYHRLLVGLEGKVTDKLKVAVLGGPDFRDFGPHVAGGFDSDDTTKLWIDALVSFSPTANDELALLVRRFEQPSYGGRAVYEDMTYQLAYRRKINSWLKAQVVLQAYAGEWLAPVVRDDWIYTASVSLAGQFSKNLSGELGWSIDRAESKVPNTSGREFTRHLVWAGVKWTF